MVKKCKPRKGAALPATVSDIESLKEFIKDELTEYVHEQQLMQADLVIIKADNGWVLKGPGLNRVVEVDPKNYDDVGDNLEANMNMLWEVVDFFALRPDRYAEWRVKITKEHGSKWVKPKGYKEPKED
jgi:hypothetical protein